MNKRTCLAGGTFRCKFGLLRLRYKHPGKQTSRNTHYTGKGITPGVLLTQVVCRVCSVNAEFLTYLPPHALSQLFLGVGCGDLFLVGACRLARQLASFRLPRSPPLFTEASLTHATNQSPVIVSGSQRPRRLYLE